MKQLRYISGNKSKFKNALEFMESNNIELVQEILHLDEIQSESSEDIALKKARQAYKLLNVPLFVNDASWHIPALGGFPGPFMKYMVKWLKEDDLLRLMQNASDRTIILKDTIAFTDGTTEKVFARDVLGTVLQTPKGESDGPFVTKLISFSDDGKSLAQVRSSGFTDRELPLWNEFAEWLKENL